MFRDIYDFPLTEYFWFHDFGLDEGMMIGVFSGDDWLMFGLFSGDDRLMLSETFLFLSLGFFLFFLLKYLFYILICYCLITFLSRVRNLDKRKLLEQYCKLDNTFNQGKKQQYKKQKRNLTKLKIIQKV